MTALRFCLGVQCPVMTQVCPRGPLRQKLMGHSTRAGSQQSHEAAPLVEKRGGPVGDGRGEVPGGLHKFRHFVYNSNWNLPVSLVASQSFYFFSILQILGKTERF